MLFPARVIACLCCYLLAYAVNCLPMPLFACLCRYLLAYAVIRLCRYMSMTLKCLCCYMHILLLLNTLYDDLLIRLPREITFINA